MSLTVFSVSCAQHIYVENDPFVSGNYRLTEYMKYTRYSPIAQRMFLYKNDGHWIFSQFSDTHSWSLRSKESVFCPAFQQFQDFYRFPIISGRRKSL